MDDRYRGTPDEGHPEHKRRCAGNGLNRQRSHRLDDIGHRQDETLRPNSAEQPGLRGDARIGDDGYRRAP